jgi:ribosomal protein L37AE/L43A
MKKAGGWSVEIGIRMSIVVGVWACPKCQKKEANNARLSF